MKKELLRTIKYAKVGAKSDVRKIRKLAKLVKDQISEVCNSDKTEGNY